jgi:hypothetical protein
MLATGNPDMGLYQLVQTRLQHGIDRGWNTHERAARAEACRALLRRRRSMPLSRRMTVRHGQYRVCVTVRRCDAYQYGYPYWKYVVGREAHGYEAKAFIYGVPGLSTAMSYADTPEKALRQLRDAR